MELCLSVREFVLETKNRASAQPKHTHNIPTLEEWGGGGGGAATTAAGHATTHHTSTADWLLSARTRYSFRRKCALPPA